MFLKYYFESNNGNISLNSIACEEADFPQVPNFLKWYEEGDIDFSLGNPEINGGIFQTIFQPRKLTKQFLGKIGH